MNTRMIEKTRKEIAVYLAIISGEGKTARDISSETGFKYRTVTDIIERLRDKGMIESLQTTTREGFKHRAVTA